MRDTNIEKNFNHLEVEERIYESWTKNKLFVSDPKSDKKKFSIMMPPPNVTGTLHIGHALNMTIQDILARYWRMNNRDVLWQPGTDHAGIATQKIVESNLKTKNLNKIELGKSKFLEEVWKWKDQSGSKIINQIKRLGASPDWGRERFTLDKEMSEAVIYVFISLFNKGLIYKDKRLINWDINLQTALSDLEVEQKEQEGEFVYIKYFSEKTPKKFLEVATTRPETIFGDQCLAVNPADARYKKLIGQKVLLPLVKKYIPIISDKYVDMKKGTGVLKITPAHDFNDYKVGIKHNLEMKIVFDKHGKFNKNVPEKFQGKDRLLSRKDVVEELERNGNLSKIEKIIHTIPFGDRSGSLIEPYLTDQWFLNVKPLAKEVIKAVKKKETVFYPTNWTKTFYLWMDEIEPWCISRQIWWGHRIPVWYGHDNKIFVAKDEQEANNMALNYYKKKTKLIQETDVLDTWFSSALWPMSTLGWPNTKDLYFKKYFPTNVLVTGFDIIFFWVARMMMKSTFFTKLAPFKEVYIHALVRDKLGNKMSKSRGNIIDPLNIIDKYGADALRFTLSSMAAQGRDIKLSEDVVKINRNFLTKIRNAFNFLNINRCFENKEIDLDRLRLDENIWILQKLNFFVKNMNNYIQTYRFNDASKEIYKFTKNIFCDWYLEFIKISLIKVKGSELENEIKYCASLVFNNTLKLSHPFMPFITDEIYTNYMRNKKFLMQESWPLENQIIPSKPIMNSIDKLIDIISKLRNIRATLNIPPKLITEVYCVTNSNKNKNFLTTNENFINSLARVKFNISNEKTLKKLKGNFLKFIHKDNLFYIKKEKIDNQNIQLDNDLKILNSQLKTLEYDINLLKKKLENKDFIEKAPSKVIEKFQNKMKEKLILKRKIMEQIKSL